MRKRTLLQITCASLLMTLLTGCIVINVSKSEDKKPKPKGEYEEVNIETNTGCEVARYKM